MSKIISLSEARRQRQIPVHTSIEQQAMALIDVTHHASLAYNHPLPLHDLLFVDDQGKPLSIRWFHKEWANLIMNHRAVLIEAPRGTGKSSFLETVIAWYIGRNPNIRILILCENDSQAEKRLVAVKEIITEHPLYKYVFPNVQLDKTKKNNQSQLHVVRTARGMPHPTLEARGITSAGAGNRVDLMVLDDPVSYRNAIQYPKLQQEVIQKYLNDWYPTLNPRDGRIVSIFTPWKKDDLNGYLKASKGWVHRRYAHGRPGDIYHSIFPELFSREKLIIERDRMGSVNYARAYLCQSIPEGSVVIPENFIQTYTELELTHQKLMESIATLSIDPASGKEATRTGQLDFTGFNVSLTHIPTYSTSSRPSVPLLKDSITTKKPRPSIFVPEAFRTKATSLQSARLAVQLSVQWGVENVLCEAQALSELYSRIMEARDRIPIYARPNFQVHPITVGPISKGQRLLNMTPLLELDEEAGIDRPIMLFHPRVIDPHPHPFYLTLSDGTVLEAMRTLRSELLDFPTQHDDVMDSLTQNGNWQRRFLLPGYSASGTKSSAGVTVSVL